MTSEDHQRSENHQALLDAVARLTRQRDHDSLAAALVDAVACLTPANSIAVYSLGNELGQIHAKVIASNHPQERPGSHFTSLKSRPEFKACIEHNKPIHHSTPQGEKMVLPITQQGSLSGLLSLGQDSNSSTDTSFIERLLEIYANQYSLLNLQHRDSLTGLFNRAALQNHLNKNLRHSPQRRSQDDNQPGCLAIFDIDYFKVVNDTQGHLYGDEVLLTFADLMRETFRSNDRLFRYGGEEFVAILSDTTLDTTLTVLERFRAKVAQHPFPHRSPVTVTIGVAQIRPELPASSLIDHADKALYYGKQHGRNQVNAYEWLEQGQIVPNLGAHPQSHKLF